MIKLWRRFEASFADHLWKTASLWHRSAYNMKDKQRKKYLASLTDWLVVGQIGRRDFLRSAGKLGLGAGALGLGLRNRPFGLFPLAHAQLQPSADIMAWLKDVAKPFAGTRR